MYALVQISSCADCLELAIEVPEGDVPDLGDPADVESVIDREALGRCACGEFTQFKLSSIVAWSIELNSPKSVEGK